MKTTSMTNRKLSTVLRKASADKSDVCPKCGGSWATVRAESPLGHENDCPVWLAEIQDPEDEIIRTIDRAHASSKRYADKLRELRSKLKNCQHKHAVTYQWEHDNGYGRQTMITGRRCLSCEKRCPWPSSTNWS